MPKDLEALREHKRELLLESDINRQILVLETTQVKIKAIEWRRSLLKAGTVYKWVAPVAGLGLGFFAARKRVQKAQSRHSNGHSGKLGYLRLLAPLGLSAVRQVLKSLRHSRANTESTSAE